MEIRVGVGMVAELHAGVEPGGEQRDTGGLARHPSVQAFPR